MGGGMRGGGDGGSADGWLGLGFSEFRGLDQPEEGFIVCNSVSSQKGYMFGPHTALVPLTRNSRDSGSMSELIKVLVEGLRWNFVLRNFMKQEIRLSN